MQSRCERVTIRMLPRPQNAFAGEVSIVALLRVCTFLVKIAMICLDVLSSYQAQGSYPDGAIC